VYLDKETPSMIGRVNKSNVLHLIKECGPVSRASVARTLKMSRSTISSIIDQLINEERVVEGATGQSTSAGGRRPVYLHYVSTAKYALGIDIGSAKTLPSLQSWKEKGVLGHKFPSKPEGRDFLAIIQQEVEAFLGATAIPRSDILGTGIGFPGVTNPSNGLVIQAPGLKLANFSARESFSRLPGPILVDNDVNMGVLGERWRGVARGRDNVILVAIGTGVGAGLILDGKIYRGAGGYAGEIGHLHVDPFSTQPKRDLGDYGPLEQLASGKGMEDLAAANLASFPDTSLSAHDLTTAKLFAAAQQDDPLARYVIQQVLSYLSFSIANMVTLLNPNLVILGGGVSQVGEPLLESIRTGVARLSPIACEIAAAGLGEDAAAFGGAATVLLQAGELRLSGAGISP